MDKDDNKLCDKCGLLPQSPVQPKPPVCKRKKKCCKKDCCENEFEFRKVVIPAALGDDVTGKDKPENGAYTNSYVEYEANGAQYMYDSYGVYTKISQGEGGEGTLDFNELTNRPKYAGVEMTSATDIPSVEAETEARIAADATFWGRSYASGTNTVNGRVQSKDDSYTGTFADTYGSGGFEYYSTGANPVVISVRRSPIVYHGRLQISTNEGWLFYIGNNLAASIGDSGMDMKTHKISNVIDPTQAQDAATKNYVDSIYPVGSVFTSTSSTAPTIAGGTWAQIGSQVIGSSTVYYYERTA